ncbi:hypothetical protein L873DRAFT_1793401 [Choiromyces venosus 120613-1]|uniref:Uncharacterized protein n=1 Tax=Choiromyces venosus 120613-1 TaxID=1336337 RepID=A0A3N4JIW4_9PEZI|nr:hypothetical protein L873DRAFT_1793401 [Choiromyces venosus 120613-1]
MNAHTPGTNVPHDNTKPPASSSVPTNDLDQGSSELMNAVKILIDAVGPALNADSDAVATTTTTTTTKIPRKRAPRAVPAGSPRRSTRIKSTPNSSQNPPTVIFTSKEKNQPSKDRHRYHVPDY